MTRTTRLFAFAALLAGAPLLPAAPDGTVQVTLLQTTDIHDHGRGAGHVSTCPPALGGYPRIAAYVEQVRSSCGHPVLLVDSGDWSMGTLYDLTLDRRPLALGFADALGYDCITLGNHEFDQGPGGLAAILRAAARGPGLCAPIVASNLEPNGDVDLAPFLGPGKAIRETLVKSLPNGLRVGFLGLMGKAAAGDGSAAAPVRFADYSRNYGLVQRLVDQLRGRQGCRLVVALDHAGTNAAGTEGEDVDLARHVTGIDVIASGHAHNPLASAQTVANGAWTTRIFCAGAYGANVSRMDLAFPAVSGPPTLEASSNLAMTDAALAALDPPARPDRSLAALLRATDLDLNRLLAPVFTGVARFGDYAPADPATGIYHPVAGCAQDLPSNQRDAVPAPNGLGNLCADAMRAAANGLRAADRDPAPFIAAGVATGELRGALGSGAPVTFADVYGILPLGLSPDPAQAGTTGEPLVSGYVDDTGLRTLCALQLFAQTGLPGQDYYLNLSGIRYGLEPKAAAAFFASVGAATALELTWQRAQEGSALAGHALGSLTQVPSDHGAALLGAKAAGNPYADAMVRLGAADPVPVASNLALLVEVATAAERDAGSGSATLERLLIGRAMAAIGPLAAFAPGDAACTGPALPLGPGRHRIVLDMYQLLMAAGAEARLGVNVDVYQAAQGGARLTGIPAMLANRINLTPGGRFTEVKAWMAILMYLSSGHFADGWITPEYGGSADFTRFPTSGAAVRTRNATYPLGPIGDLAAMAQTLRQAP